MDDAYSGYYVKHKRFKRKKKVFPYIVAILALGIVFFVANMIFVFVDFGAPKDSVDFKSITFYTIESEAFASKADAIETATMIKDNGGSGYLLSRDNKWFVVDEIDNTALQDGNSYTTQTKSMKLLNIEDKAIVESITGTFPSTFETLCNYIDDFKNGKLTQFEIANASRQAYNNLIDMAEEFEVMGYTDINIYLTRQLLGLNLIWVNAESDNFIHVLKNATCWVAFAYIDLVNSL